MRQTCSPVRSLGLPARRRAPVNQTALGTRTYHWVFEADIQACFDELKHSAVIAEVRKRVTDKRVLSLVDRFLKAGIMSAAGKIRESDTGTPQGGNISPLLANIALKVLDKHFCDLWDAHGTPNRRNPTGNGADPLQDHPLSG